MAAHLKHSYPIALNLYRLGEVLLCNSNTLKDRWLRKNLASVKVVSNLAENPRATIRCTTNHHRIHAIAVKHLLSLYSRVNISIADNWNMDSRVVLNLAYKSPVRLASIHLTASTTMDCKCRNTNILQSVSYLLNILTLIVPAEASLYCHGLTDSVYNLARHLNHQRHIAHHTATCTTTRDFLHRAAEVYINNIWICSLGNLCRLYHRLYLISINLDTHRALKVRNLKLCKRLSRITNKPIRGYKLRSDHIGTEELTHISERWVGNILHRRKEKGSITKCNICNLHHFFLYI